MLDSVDSPDAVAEVERLLPRLQGDQLGAFLDRHVQQRDIASRNEQEISRCRIGCRRQEDSCLVGLVIYLFVNLALCRGGYEGDGPDALAGIFNQASLVEGCL